MSQVGNSAIRALLERRAFKTGQLSGEAIPLCT